MYDEILKEQGLTGSWAVGVTCLFLHKHLLGSISAWSLKVIRGEKGNWSFQNKEKLQKQLIFINGIILYNPLEDTQFSLLRALMSQFVIWYFVEFAVNRKKWMLLLNFSDKLNPLNFVLEFLEGSCFVFFLSLPGNPLPISMKSCLHVLSTQ